MAAKPKSIMKKMAARDLEIHPLAQRAIIPSKLARLKAEFDLDAVGVIHAVYANIRGAIVALVVDGQHRIIALKELDFGDWPVDVKIHLDVTDDAGACRLFLRLNDRAPVSPYDKYTAEVNSGVTGSVAVASIIRKRGLRASRSTGPGCICCVTALKGVYKQHGPVILDTTLDVLLAAWGKSPESLDGRLVAGVANVLATYGDIDEAALVKALARYSGGPLGLIGAALGIRTHRKATMPTCIAELIVEAYNNKRRVSRLVAA